MPDAEPVTCGRCGHEMTLSRCGMGTVSAPGKGIRYLCHADDHSCYNVETGGTSHTHREFVEGCHRCQMSREEARA